MGEGKPGLTTLDQLQPGEQGTIHAVSGGDSLATRIMEMGVTPGEMIARTGTAPLGDPLEFTVRHYRLSLRRMEAARVEIVPGKPAATTT